MENFELAIDPILSKWSCHRKKFHVLERVAGRWVWLPHEFLYQGPLWTDRNSLSTF